jgi:hypothetical protein
MPIQFSIKDNEWCILVEYLLDLPVPGGIAALEASHKAKWCKSFSSNEVKIVVAGIYAIQCQTQCMVINKLNFDLYIEKVKQSVASMAIIVQTMGLISKKKLRGKNKLTNN